MSITRQELHNMSDMLRGCVNRIFVSDDAKEVSYLIHHANYYLSTIYKENLDRVYAQQERAETGTEKEQQFISPELSPDELPFG